MKKESILSNNVDVRRSVLWPPIAVFFVLLTVAFAVFFNTRAEVQSEQQTASNEFAEVVESDISKRLELFGESLLGGSAFFQSSNNISQQQWSSYIGRKGTLDRFPGAQGLGYAVALQPGEVENYNASTANKLFPKGNRDEYTAIKFISPDNESNRKALGYDMFSDETRREAMEKARDSGGVFLSDPVRLVQDNSDAAEEGLLMYAASYNKDVSKSDVSQKRDALEGYFYAVFRMQVFVTNALQPNSLQSPVDFEVRIGEGDNERSVFRSANFEDAINNHTGKTIIERTKDVYGRRFVFRYSYNPSELVNGSTQQRPQTVLLFGLFAAGLIGIVTWLLLRVKANELALSAQQSTNDAKDNLLSIASHQLRTPATGVKQYIGMVMQGFTGEVSPAQQAMLEKAYDSNERQLRTINDVLYLARLDSGRIVLSKAKFSVKKLVQSVVDEQADAIKSNQHTLIVDLPKSELWIHGDEHMVRMCVENLVSNAIKYTPEKGEIAVSVVSRDSQAVISVKDNGVGISEDDQKELLFRQFSRISNELSKSVSGSGIGLYLTKHLIELHDGQIQVESQSKQGSTFTILLPCEPPIEDEIDTKK